MEFRFPPHLHLSTLIILMTPVISGVIADVGYQMPYNMLEPSAQDSTQRASRDTIKDRQSAMVVAVCALITWLH